MHFGGCRARWQSGQKERRVEIEITSRRGESGSQRAPLSGAEASRVDESGSRASNIRRSRRRCANHQCKESPQRGLADLVRGNRGGVLRLLRGLLIRLLPIRERALGFFTRHSRAFHEQIRRLLAIGRGRTTLLEHASEQRLYFGVAPFLFTGFAAAPCSAPIACIACCLILSPRLPRRRRWSRMRRPTLTRNFRGISFGLDSDASSTKRTGKRSAAGSWEIEKPWPLKQFARTKRGFGKLLAGAPGVRVTSAG